MLKPTFFQCLGLERRLSDVLELGYPCVYIYIYINIYIYIYMYPLIIYREPVGARKKVSQMIGTAALHTFPRS